MDYLNFISTYKIMLKKLIGLLTVLFLTAAPAWAEAAESSSVFTTGKDWAEKMSVREKFIAVIVPMAVFDSYGVRFGKRPEEYMPLIDRVIGANPRTQEEDVANIFVSTIYLTEPWNRPILDSLESKFLQGDYEPGAPDVRILRELE